jgi:hypothetical protein
MRLILISPNGRILDRRTVASMGRSRTDYGLADCKELSTFGAPDWLGRSQGLLFGGAQRWAPIIRLSTHATFFSPCVAGYGRHTALLWAS